MKKHLLTLYTRTPLHVGSGTSVEVVDLPIMRERITGFPVIPGTSLKGVLRQECVDHCGPEAACRLFGNDTAERDKEKHKAGCVICSDARLLAFPVRSLAGCFAWITCPVALERFKRDSGHQFSVPPITGERVIAGKSLRIESTRQVVLEEYALESAEGNLGPIVEALKPLCGESVWADTLAGRLALVTDELFQHFVSTTTEVTTRIKINASTRTAEEGALFNQEDVPSEALFYALLVLHPERARNGSGWTIEDVISHLTKVVTQDTLLQIGGDETTGHGFCSVRLTEAK